MLHNDNVSMSVIILITSVEKGQLLLYSRLDCLMIDGARNLKIT